MKPWQWVGIFDSILENCKPESQSSRSFWVTESKFSTVFMKTQLLFGKYNRSLGNSFVLPCQKKRRTVSDAGRPGGLISLRTSARCRWGNGSSAPFFSAWKRRWLSLSQESRAPDSDALWWVLQIFPTSLEEQWGWGSEEGRKERSGFEERGGQADGHNLQTLFVYMWMQQAWIYHLFKTFFLATK